MRFKFKNCMNILLVTATILFVIEQVHQVAWMIEIRDLPENLVAPWFTTQNNGKKLAIQDAEQALKRTKARAITLRNNCYKYAKKVREYTPRRWNSYTYINPMLFFSEDFDLIYCLVYKAGSTHWRKLYQVLQGRQKDLNFRFEDVSLTQINPVDIKFNHTKIIIFRDPLDRLLSCYRDKIEPRGPWNSSFTELNAEILKINNYQGTSMFGIQYPTFIQFVEFILSDNPKLTAKRTWEPRHWMDYMSSCNLCKTQYDHVITMENATQESNALLREIGAPSSLSFPPAYTNQSHVQIFNEYYSTLSSKLYNRLCGIYSLDYLLFGRSCPIKPT